MAGPLATLTGSGWAPTGEPVSAAGFRVSEFMTVATGQSFVVPPGVFWMYYIGCGPGAGGGGGHATGGGGGGGGAGACVVEPVGFAVTPNETLTIDIPDGGAGGTVGNNGSLPAADTFIKRGVATIARLRAPGIAGVAGAAGAGGGGGQGSGDHYLAGGAQGTNANGTGATDSYGQDVTGGGGAAVFLPGAAGGGGIYVSSGGPYTGGRGGRTHVASFYGQGGTASATGGAGGGGAAGWPQIYPNDKRANGALPIGGNGGNPTVAGQDAQGYGAGGGGGGTNAAGGKGGQGFIVLLY